MRMRGLSPQARAYAMLRQMSNDLTLGEAAKALGVSADTLRRWDRAGRLHTHRDERNRRLWDGRLDAMERRLDELEGR